MTLFLSWKPTRYHDFQLMSRKKVFSYFAYPANSECEAKRNELQFLRVCKSTGELHNILNAVIQFQEEIMQSHSISSKKLIIIDYETAPHLTAIINAMEKNCRARVTNGHDFYGSSFRHLSPIACHFAAWHFSYRFSSRVHNFRRNKLGLCRTTWSMNDQRLGKVGHYTVNESWIARRMMADKVLILRRH